MFLSNKTIAIACVLIFLFTELQAQIVSVGLLHYRLKLVYVAIEWQCEQRRIIVDLEAMNELGN